MVSPIIEGAGILAAVLSPVRQVAEAGPKRSFMRDQESIWRKTNHTRVNPI